MYNVNDLGKRYVSEAGEKWALRHVSFSLPEKGLVAIRGQSGSGKSTLLNILATMERPNEGSVSFAGEDLKKRSQKELADLRNFSFGFLYQHFNLLEDETALQNVMLPLLIRGRKNKEAKETAEALFVSYGLKDLEDKKCAVLSGGEKQRVALLRALIGEPQVIFADEPTGALDKKNEALVMESLERISKSKLVIFVSHNERLITRFGERVLTLAEGKLVSDTRPERPISRNAVSEERRGHLNNWKGPLLLAHFKKNLGKNLLSFVSGAIGFASILVSASFVYGSQKALDLEKKKSLLYYQCSLGEKISYPIEGSPLKLSKSKRPSMETANVIFGSTESVSIENDYSYFLPSYSVCSLDGEATDPVSLSPVFDLTLSEFASDLLVDGKTPFENDIDSCLINQELADLYSFSLIGKNLEVKRTFSLSAFDATDDMTISYSFRVAGIVKEFSFLNSPRIYYSYSAVRTYFQGVKLEKISASAERTITIDGLLSEALGDEPFASYSYLCFAHSESDAMELRKIQERLSADESTCKISNPTYEIEKGFSSLRQAVEVSLVPFIVIEVISVAFIIGALAYSTFVEHRKEAAILSALGAENSAVSSTYFDESLLVTMSSSVFALFLLPLIEKIVNPFLASKTGMSGLLSLPSNALFGIPFSVPLAVLVLAFVLTAVGSCLPLAIARRKPLVESLRDE